MTYQELMNFWSTTGLTDFYNHEHDEKGRFTEEGTPATKPEPGQPSDVLKIYGTSYTKDSARAAVAAIESVHGLPKELYRPVMFHEFSGHEGLWGEYTVTPENKPKEISVNSLGSHLELTTTHEFGHYVDHQFYINRNDVLPTIKASFDYKQLESEKGHEMGYVDYLLNDKETFARAYAQYVATRSGNEKLQGQVESIRNEFGAKHNSQWDAKDFEPIAEAFDKAFADKGLLKSSKQTLNAAATFANDCHDSATGRFCETGGGYQPDPTAPDEGEWIRTPYNNPKDPYGLKAPDPVWRQSHAALVQAALHSWKGESNTMSLHMGDAQRNDPKPSSGGGKQMRVQAEALLWELHHNSIPTTKPLYRGAETDPKGIEAWSELKSIAKGFQKKGSNANLYMLPKGTQGIRISDYIHSQLNDSEREWVVDTTGRSPILASAAEQLEFANQCHDPANGQFCENGEGISPTWDKALAKATPSPEGYGAHWILKNGDYANAHGLHSSVFANPNKASVKDYQEFAKQTGATRIYVGDDNLEISVMHPMTKDQIDSIVGQAKPYVAIEATKPDGSNYTEDIHVNPDNFKELENALNRANQAVKGREVTRPRTSFANQCHDEKGRFCEGQGGPTLATASEPVYMRDIKSNHPEQAAVFQGALDAIQSVHELPKDLPQAMLQIDPSLPANTGGVYSEDTGMIRINPADLNTMGQLNFIHEFGHHLSLANGGLIYPTDNKALKLGSKFLEKLGQNDLGNWYYQTTQSKAFGRQFQREGQNDDYASYLKNPKELFARSYTQWVVSHSSDPQLKKQFETWRYRGDSNDVQWTDTDFQPIGKALDEYFSTKHLTASAAQVFANECHDSTGRFCETGGGHGTNGAAPKEITIPKGLTGLEVIDHVTKALGQDQTTNPETNPERYAPNKGFGFHLKEGETQTRTSKDADNNPILQDLTAVPFKSLGDRRMVTGDPNVDMMLPHVVTAERPLPYVFRVVSEDEYQGILKNGYIKSDQRMNLADEGTVASADSTGSFYMVPGENRVLRIKQRAEDGWKVDPADEYIKTHQKVPASQIDLVTPPITMDNNRQIVDSAVVASANLEFANPCHDAKGEFCETTGGAVVARASDVEQKLALKKARAKIKAASVPSREEVIKHRAALLKAEQEGTRAGGEFRGNSTDRKHRQLALWKEFGGEEKGFVTDAATGVKMHWTKDPKLNPSHLPTFTQGKIWTGHQGGSYRLEWLIPELLQSNQARGDTPVRKENLD